MKKFVIILIITISLGCLFAASFTASYNAVSPISWGENNLSSSFNYKLVAHIGQMTIVFNDEPDLKNMVLVNLGGYTQNTYLAQTAWPPYPTQTASFQFYAITSINSVITNQAYIWTNPGSDFPFQLLSGTTQTLAGKNVTIDFYLVTDNSISWHWFPIQITLNTNLTTGSLAIVQNNGSIWDPSDFIPIEIDSGYYEGNTEQIDIWGNQPRNENNQIITYYGDVPEQPTPEYEFWINDDYDFDIRNCQGTNKEKAGEAFITVSQKPGAVILSFSKPPEATQGQFAFSHSVTGDTIPYMLQFGSGSPLTLDDSFNWSPLSIGNHSLDIFVTGIAQADITGLIAGLYSDTIIVTITPEDTI